MKKSLLFILALFIVYLLLSNTTQTEILYPAGKDTAKSFGDGTYQIFTSQTTGGLRKETLYNCKYHLTIIPQVEYFQIANGKVYVIGKSTRYYLDNGADIECSYEHYAVIETETNMLTLCLIPVNSSGEASIDVYIRILDEMIQNGDVQLLCQLTDFSEDDRSVFEGLCHYLNSK